MNPNSFTFNIFKVKILCLFQLTHTYLKLLNDLIVKVNF